MKAFTTYLTIVLALVALPAAAMAAPKAVPETPVYQFVPVPEGQGMSHDFIVKNDGDEPLKILDVIPP